MQQIAEKHGARARFAIVYIKEAHPTDEWQVTSNEKDGVCYAQPQTVDDRIRIARDFTEKCKVTIPMLADKMDNECERLYSAWPERIYVIGADGTILYKGGMGPFDFKPDDLDTWLAAQQ